MSGRSQNKSRKLERSVLPGNLEDYLMQMRSVTDISARPADNVEMPLQRKDAKSGTKPQESPEPIVETEEKVLSPGVIQYTTRVVREASGCGQRTVRTVSRVVNRPAGTLLTVERNDVVNNCPALNGELESDGPGFPKENLGKSYR